MRLRRVVSKFWQDLMAGRLRTPQAIIRSAYAEDALPDARFFDPPPDDPTWRVPSRLKVADHWFTSEGALRQYDKPDWAHTDPRLIYWAYRFVDEARKRGIPLYVHTALRDKATQDALVAKGHSKAKYPLSAHNIGEAVDIVHGLFHWNMTVQEWTFLHELGRRVLDRCNAGVPKDRQLHLTWGGNFRSLYDPAHWEISDFRDRRRFLGAVAPVRYTPRGYFRQHRSM